MKAKMDKCHLLISRSENITINVEGNICEKLLDLSVIINGNSTNTETAFNKKTGRKVNALFRKLPYMNFEKRHVNELVFYIKVQLLPFSMDVSKPCNE